MLFDASEWVMNATGDMLFNVHTYKTIRKRIWHDNSRPDTTDDFSYFSFHELNAAQAVAFLFPSEKDAKTVHAASCSNNWNFDMVDYQMWILLDRIFKNGLADERTNTLYE